MNRRRVHGAPETAHLTAQTFDEAPVATQGLMMVEFSDLDAGE